MKFNSLYSKIDRDNSPPPKPSNKTHDRDEITLLLAMLSLIMLPVGIGIGFGIMEIFENERFFVFGMLTWIIFPAIILVRGSKE